MRTSESTSGGGRVERVETLTAEQAGAVRGLLAEAARVDGREAVSEAGRLRIRPDSPRPGVRHLVQTADGRVTGYAQAEGADPGTVELTVAPADRGRGLGGALVRAVLDGADGELDFWAHGGLPAARHLAEVHGAVLVRELRQMRRTAEAPDAVSVPAGVELRTFEPGRDEQAWLALNALAFAHHPEQGSWTEQDLAERMAEPWFDPKGFFLAERDGRLVGFHWTKTQPDGLGEVYVVGVDPAEQGGGLGRALTAVGLRHLILERGLPTVMLYVDADNAAAVRVYERLGFTVHEVDLMYRWAPSTGR
ncbi:mycothiol synthase [Kitasatospora sp. NPDC059646]|uniref:mycothiol synthase n=1 Tax=Kitasatospora sp. NPDC059646 TaxID=3346893 RepID=UPI0036BBF608